MQHCYVTLCLSLINKAIMHLSPVTYHVKPQDWGGGGGWGVWTDPGEFDISMEASVKFACLWGYIHSLFHISNIYKLS